MKESRNDKYTRLKNEITEFIKTHNRRPDHRSEDPVENHLGHWNMEFRQKARPTYDQTFRETQDKLCKSLGAEGKTSTPLKERLHLIKEFIVTNKRYPRYDAQDSAEKGLAPTFLKYWYEDHRDADIQKLIEEMRALRNEHCPVRARRSSDEISQSIIQFVRENKRLPRRRAKDEYERKLGKVYEARKYGKMNFDEFIKQVEEALNEGISANVGEA